MIGVTFALIKNVKRGHADYENTVSNSAPQIIRSPELTNAFRDELMDYEKANDTSNQVYNRAHSMPFPDLGEPQAHEKAQTLIERLVNTFENHSLKMAAGEQVLLGIFPPDQLYEIFSNSLGAVTEQGVSFANDAADIILKSFQNGTHTAQEIFSGLTHGNISTFEQLIQAHGQSIAGAESIKDAAGSFAMDVLKAPASDIGHSLYDHAGQAVHSIGDNVHGIHPDPTAHFPYVTLFISGFREVNLLMNDKTSIETSLKNLGLDVAGTGLGAVGGGKIGALIGTAIVPGIGTAIGGAIGAIGGAIGGRFLSNKAKALPLNNAIESYNAKFACMENDTREIAKNATLKVNHQVTQSKEKYISGLGHIPLLENNAILMPIYKDLLAAFNEDLRTTSNQIIKLRKSFYYYLSSNKNKVDHILQALDYMKKNIPSYNVEKDNVVDALKLIIGSQFIKDGEFEKVLIMKNDKLNKTVQNMMKELLLWAETASASYRISMKEISLALQAEATTYSESCKGWKFELDSAHKAVIREQEKLGYA